MAASSVQSVSVLNVFRNLLLVFVAVSEYLNFVVFQNVDVLILYMLVPNHAIY